MGPESARERFWDEDEGQAPEPATCAGCEGEQWVRCDLPGHECIGWCERWHAFTAADEPSCEEE